MALNREDAVKRARADASKRAGVSEGEVGPVSVDDADFPDMALGAPTSGEMSGMMLTSGWRIKLQAGGKKFEYRANPDQVRLYNFNGKNYKV
jgi:hypothetical protein